MNPSTQPRGRRTRPNSARASVDAVVIGGSAGALEVLVALMPALPADAPYAVVVVLHLLRSAPSHLAQVLGAHCALPVAPALHREPVEPGCVRVGTPDHHLTLQPGPRFAISSGPPVGFSRPSIDVLFASAARSLGARVAGVLLSGGNDDGAEGLSEISRVGGPTFVQDPLSARSPEMPRAALQRFRPTRVFAPAELEGLFQQLLNERP